MKACRGFLCAVVLMIGITACGGNGTGEQPVIHEGDDPAVVQVSNMHYTPHTLVIEAGTTVEWRFEDGPTAHNVVGTSENSPPGFASPMIAQDVWSFTFDTPGEYHYVCTEHPQKTGVIIVE